MAYSREAANDFWLEYDDTFLPGAGLPERVASAYEAIGYDFDGPYSRLVRTLRNGTFPDRFVEELTGVRAALEVLSEEQLAVFDRYFGNEPASLRLAMEDFGQGVLFDPRRPRGRRVHMMDTSGPASPPVGYHRWHGFNRAFILLGLGGGRWNEIARSVGLAWEIQSILKPLQDRTDNPEMSQARLADLRIKWMGLNPEELDQQFLSEPYPPGVV
jgi:hypothetical protein